MGIFGKKKQHFLKYRHKDNLFEGAKVVSKGKLSMYLVFSKVKICQWSLSEGKVCFWYLTKRLYLPTAQMKMKIETQ